MKTQIQRTICIALAANLFSCSLFQPETKKIEEPTTVEKPVALDESISKDQADKELNSLDINAAPEKAVADQQRSDGLYHAFGAAKLKTKDSFNKKGLANKREGSTLGLGAGAIVGAGAGAFGLGASAKMAAPSHMYFPPQQSINTESYDNISENTFQTSVSKPLSTFSIDVDTASYSNMRRILESQSLPPADAVRIEEMVNYFNYDYKAPEKDAFAVNMEMAPALWNKKHKVVRIGIKGKEIKVDQRPNSNLVFLIDVSGSMDCPQGLPMVKTALNMLVDKMNENDKISIVVYAGAAGLVLPPTSGNQKMKILRALDKLQAGGSTNGGQGIELAYKMATEQFIKGGVNRVILATDGDFNVGVTGRDGLVKLVQENAKKNIYLSVLGFGVGNYRDGMMEALSNKGNGNYAYIDSSSEARKVMVEQLSGTLVTIAKDVKIQVEFNPKFVESYRLIGYEDRLLKDEDFNNDKKDAGDIGAGHTVTALYEIVPTGSDSDTKPSVDALKYQKQPKAEFASDSKEWMTIKIRYKKPDGNVSSKIEYGLESSDQSFSNASESFRFASAVALFGMLLRNSEHVQKGTFKDVISTAKNAKGDDKNSYREEFIELVKKAQSLKEMQSKNVRVEPQLGNEYEE